MTKHNYYPKELKIQIVKRLLAGESATALRTEFHIPSTGTIFTWKKWYLTNNLKRLDSSSGRPRKEQLTVLQELEEKNKELSLLKKFFSQERW
ncbi:helix-turn-helix domain-containing protein (plasmid) [Enterococcus faecium]|uniref:helix-turn-helix domain-containing protein n=1 Tax=Enterococcus TaxID=1350 RepID=UPI000824C367|nr:MULTISPECIES: helix-turn-helix domain-containing protein [Enterococcus]QIS84984.1 helix-turn-helix domain-containing protein [Enterococcus faecium]HAZ0653334.1 helix-turn-helix domain-containing protein [Enterococcus faecium]